MAVVWLIILVPVVLFIFLFNDMVLKRTRVDYNLAVVLGALEQRVVTARELAENIAETMPDESAALTELAGSYSRQAALTVKVELDKKLSEHLNTIRLQLEKEPDNAKSVKAIKEADSAMVKAEADYNESARLINTALDQPCGRLLGRVMHQQPRVIIERS